MLLAELIDHLEKWDVPIGLALGVIIVFATKSGRKAMKDSYESGKQARKKLFGTKDEDTEEKDSRD